MVDGATQSLGVGTGVSTAGSSAGSSALQSTQSCTTVVCNIAFSCNVARSQKQYRITVTRNTVPLLLLNRNLLARAQKCRNGDLILSACAVFTCWLFGWLLSWLLSGFLCTSAYTVLNHSNTQSTKCRTTLNVKHFYCHENAHTLDTGITSQEFRRRDSIVSTCAGELLVLIK